MRRHGRPYAEETKVVQAETRLSELESRMRDIARQLAAAEAAAESAAERKRREEDAAAAAAAEEEKRAEAFNAAVAAAAAELVAAQAAEATNNNNDNNNDKAAAIAANFVDANFPMDAEGHVMHLGIRKGEIANRVVSVGDHQRAALVASFLDPPPGESEVFRRASKRGFTVYTVWGGLFNVPVLTHAHTRVNPISTTQL